MISVYKEENPAGDYWLDYEDKDTVLVDHLLAGNGWKPSKDFADSFIILAKMHGIKVSISKST